MVLEFVWGRNCNRCSSLHNFALVGAIGLLLHFRARGGGKISARSFADGAILSSESFRNLLFLLLIAHRIPISIQIIQMSELLKTRKRSRTTQSFTVCILHKTYLSQFISNFFLEFNHQSLILLHCESFVFEVVNGINLR